jgi:hypothetical protein
MRAKADRPWENLAQARLANLATANWGFAKMDLRHDFLSAQNHLGREINQARPRDATDRQQSGPLPAMDGEKEIREATPRQRVTVQGR